MRSYPLVDFHSHYINGRLSAPEALLGSLEEAGVQARVLNTPLEFLRDGDREIPGGSRCLDRDLSERGRAEDRKQFHFWLKGYVQ